jgi:anti-sigma B factor antagonist
MPACERISGVSSLPRAGGSVSEDVLPWVASGRHSLEIHVDRVDGVLVVAPVGDIDMVTGGLLLEALMAAISTGESRLVVDLDRVPFMDSTALTIFLSAHRALAGASGRLVLVADDARWQHLRLPWIGNLLAVRPTILDAVRDLQAG